MYMAKIPASRTSWWRWSAKKYILTALLGMLATLAVVAGISISLAPAHISFSIASGGVLTNATGGNNNWYYNFTVVASNNISSRTAVRYGSLSVQIWYSPTGWVPAEANMAAAVCQQPGNATFPILAQSLEFNNECQQPGNATFPILAQYFEFNNEVGATDNGGQLDTDKDSSGINITWPNCKVVVEAKVWFRFRLVTTRQYTIRASCYPVDFWDNVTAVDCTF